MNKSDLYVAAVEGEPDRMVRVVRGAEDSLLIRFTDGNEEREFRANGGGVTLCRTRLDHRSPGASVTLSLAIPDQRGRCRMLPGTISIDVVSPTFKLESSDIRKIKGKDQLLRSAVMTHWGSLEE